MFTQEQHKATVAMHIVCTLHCRHLPLTVPDLCRQRVHFGRTK